MSDRYHVEHDAAGWHVYDTARRVYMLRGASQANAEACGAHANATAPGDADGYRFEVWTWYQQPQWADPRVSPSGWHMDALCTSRQQATLLGDALLESSVRHRGRTSGVTAVEVWAVDRLNPAEGMVRSDRMDATADPARPVEAHHQRTPAPGAPGPLLPWLVKREEAVHG